MAEEEGFEPPEPFRFSGFQDRRLKPLGHSSGGSDYQACLLDFTALDPADRWVSGLNQRFAKPP